MDEIERGQTNELAQIGRGLNVDPEKMRQLVSKWGLFPCLRLGRAAKAFQSNLVGTYGQQMADDAQAGKINAQTAGTYGLGKVLNLTSDAVAFGRQCINDFGEPMITDCISALS